MWANVAKPIITDNSEVSSIADNGEIEIFESIASKSA